MDTPKASVARGDAYVVARGKSATDPRIGSDRWYWGGLAMFISGQDDWAYYHDLPDWDGERSAHDAAANLAYNLEIMADPALQGRSNA